MELGASGILATQVEEAIKNGKFAKERILFALKQAEAGPPPVRDVCRQMGVSKATFYVWKKRYVHRGLLIFVNCSSYAMRTRD